MVKAHLLIDGVFEVDQRVFLPESDHVTYDGVAKSLLILSGKEKILVDTGIGDVPEGRQFDELRRSNRIRRSKTQGTGHQLAKRGISPEQITAVVNTHLHNAHAGRNNLFPNAQFYISAEEFRAVDEMESTDPNQTAYIHANFDKLKNINRVKGSYDLTDEVSVVSSPGHTPGHQSVVVKFEDHNLVYCGDVSPLKQNLVTRTPMSGYDRNLLRDSMEQLLKIENSRWIFTHDNAQLSLRQAYRPVKKGR